MYPQTERCVALKTIEDAVHLRSPLGCRLLGYFSLAIARRGAVRTSSRRIVLLVPDRHVRIVNHESTLIRELTNDLKTIYSPRRSHRIHPG